MDFDEEDEGVFPEPGEDAARRSARQAVVLMALLGAAIGAVVYVLPPSESPIYWDCPFHEITGLHCPGCGGQRALYALLHGQVVEALSLNALAVLLFAPMGGYVFVGQVLRAVGYARVGQLPADGRWWAALIVVLALFGILRNLPWGLLAWFAP